MLIISATDVSKAVSTQNSNLHPTTNAISTSFARFSEITTALRLQLTGLPITNATTTTEIMTVTRTTTKSISPLTSTVKLNIPLTSTTHANVSERNATMETTLSAKTTPSSPSVTSQSTTQSTPSVISQPTTTGTTQSTPDVTYQSNA